MFFIHVITLVIELITKIFLIVKNQLFLG